jgi:hypothetical protein
LAVLSRTRIRNLRTLAGSLTDRAAAELQSVANYRRSLALDPGNTNAAQQLQRLAAAAGAP